MSINLWNPNIGPDGDWECQSTRKASGILVLDTEGNYEAENVEGSLTEIANQVKKINNEIKYINENGTIGGGGGGGSSVPAVKVDGDLERIATTDQEITIYYYFQSPNPGNGKANLTIGIDGRDFTTTEVEIKQGRNKWVLPPQPKGVHTYSIYVVDSAALYSNVVDVTITVGALELKSNFDQYFDFTLAMPITIDFEISAIKPDPCTVEITVDGQKETMAGVIGMNRWSRQFTTLGVKKISIVAISEGIKSNILDYTIVIADSINLYISSTWPAETQVEFNTNVVIPYRLSLIGNTSFIAEYYIDGSQIDRVTAKIDNYWNIGRDLAVRVAPYELKIKAFTKDLQTWSELKFLLTVTEVGFVKVFEVKDKLIASFTAAGKNNDSELRNVWQGYSETGTVGATATLYNFNYRTSGWFDDALVFAGKAYATVDIAPLANEIMTGFTFDILFQTENAGDIDAIVADFCNDVTPFQGFTINTQKATMTSIQNKTADAKFRERTWTRITCTVDRDTNIMFMYINGIISRAILLHSSETFKYAGRLALGGKLVDGAITRIGKSAIKSMRIYSKALNYMEVLQNLIADLPTLEEQAEMTALNSPTLGIPTMKISGNLDIIMDGKSEAPVSIEYVYSQDPNQNFNKDNCYIQLQGTSSTGYPIKNFTIKLRDGGNEFYFPHNPGFIDWLPECRFTLKADFMDSSHANNVGLARYCNDFFIANNNPYPMYTKNPKTRSTIQGYPINLVINNKSYGIYNFNLDRYSNINYGFAGEPSAVSYEIAVNSSSAAGGAGAFATEDWESIRTEFKHRYNYRYIEGQPTTEVTEIIVTGEGAERVETEVLKAGRHQELQDVIGWTFNASLYEFKSSALAEHWSVPHLIDYYLIVYVMGLVDSYGKNMCISTLGRDPITLDTVWFPHFYDCDTCFGLSNDGTEAYGPDLDLDSGEYNTSDSLLWTKLNHPDTRASEITARYKALRLNGWFTTEKIMTYLDDGYIKQIGQRHFNDDAYKKYIENEESKVGFLILCNGNRLEITKRWLDERFIYLDSIFETDTYINGYITIRTNTVKNIRLGIRTYSPMYIKVSLSDEVGNIKKVKINTLINDPTWIEGVTGNTTDNNMRIYGAQNIMGLYGTENMFLSAMLISSATKLLEVSCANSRFMKSVSFGANKLLQKIDCKNCVNLGLEDKYKLVDLSACDNLKYVDFSGTKLGGITFNDTGGSLEFLDLRNTKITSCNLKGQEYLPSLLLGGCTNLYEVKLEACNSLTSVSMPNTMLGEFVAHNCTALTDVDISGSPQMSSLDVTGSTNIVNLNISSCNNLLSLDVLLLDKLKTLNVSNCDKLDYIRFKDGTSTLTSLTATSSGLTHFRFGRLGAASNILDLSLFTFSSISFNNCQKLKEIKGIRLIGGGANAFRNCINLTKIAGTIQPSGGVSSMFYGCKSLATWPTVNMANVTSGDRIFEGCVLMDRTVFQNILQTMTKFQSGSWIFLGCTGIVYDDANPMPATLFNKLTAATGLHYFLGSCSNIKCQLPNGLFDAMTNITSLSYFFYGSKIKGYIPLSLFSRLTKLTNVEYMFGATALTNLPNEEIFRNNTNLTTMRYLFTGVSTMSPGPIPSLFKGLSKLTNIEGVFSGLTLNGNIPTDLFQGCTALHTITNLFNGQSRYDANNNIKPTGIYGTIPPTLFADCPNLQYASGAFASCNGLTGEIPEDLFVPCTKLNNINSFFYNCNHLTGPIPPNLINRNITLLYANSLLHGCSELYAGNGVITGLPETFFAGMNRLVEINNIFSGLSRIISTIPATLFRDCASLRKISGLFYNCQELFGPIPETLFDVYTIDSQTGLEVKVDLFITDAEALFYNCRNLVGTIPGKLFRSMVAVTNMNNMFRNCVGLTGGIPAQLFSTCYELRTANDFFRCCHNLGEPYIDEEHEYGLPMGLFSQCSNLMEVQRMFYMYPDNSSWGSGNKFIGGLPPDLFANNGKLTTVSQFMYFNTGFPGPLASTMFAGCSKLESVYEMFRNATGITDISIDFLSKTYNPLIRDFTRAFYYCTNLTGTVPDFWNQYANVTSTECYRGLTQAKINNWDVLQQYISWI